MNIHEIPADRETDKPIHERLFLQPTTWAEYRGDSKITINEMPAGREMDALVHGLVFQEIVLTQAEARTYIQALNPDRPHISTAYHHDLFYRPNHGSPQLLYRLPEHSTDIAAAWKVVEHILVHDKRLLQFRAEILSGGKYQYAKFIDCGDDLAPVLGACATSMPLAICRAALKVTAKSDS